MLITRAMSVWSSYYDTGTAEVTILSNNEASVIIKDFPDIDIAHVKNVQGWLEQFLSMCKFKDVQSEIAQCQCYGNPITELRFRFKS